MAPARRRFLYIEGWPQTFPTRLMGLVRWEGARFRSVSAYFRLSLRTASELHVLSPAAFLRDPACAQRYDGIVLPDRMLKQKSSNYERLLGLLGRLSIPKVLLDAADDPGTIAPDKTLDVFDLVFKREPFRDRDRYGRSVHNRAKIHATMLPCLSLRPSRFRSLAKVDIAAYGKRVPAAAPGTDVFFLGGATAQARLDVVRRLKREPFTFRGGLHPDLSDLPVEPFIASPRVLQSSFITSARDARINLALAGRGPFTFRHLDFWCLCCFMLSPPDIAELETPIPYVDGRHYVGFSSIDDLVEKCRYYLAHDGEREKIAFAGRRLFEEHYSFRRHGAAIAAAMGWVG